MSLNYNSVNFSCRVVHDNNNAKILSCDPQYIENFQVVSNEKLTEAGWYQVAGTVSGTGGGGDSNVFTTDSNWAYNNERIPVNWFAIGDALQILSVGNNGSNIVSNIAYGNAGNLILTLGRNSNVSGSQTFWFKNTLADGMGGNKIAEFRNIGLTW